MNEPFNELPKPKTPDESQIESLLSRFTPRPSERFSAKMQDAPWLITNDAGRIGFFDLKILVRRMAFGFAVLVILAVMCLSFFPSVRAVARQIYFSFIHAQSNQIEVQVTLSNPGDLFHFSDPNNFSLKIDAVQEQAGYFVREIARLPEDLVLVGGRFDPDYDAVTILYQGNDYKLFLTQRPVDNGLDIFSIGSNAQVELVSIGNYQGEFVIGGWKAVSTTQVPSAFAYGGQADIIAVWDNNLSQITLRWQKDGYAYELRTLGDSNLSKSDLIALANELK